MIFETERLTIRASDPERDLDACVALYGDDRVTRWIGMAQPIASREEIRSLIERSHARDATGHWRLGVWSVDLKATGEMVGCVLLKTLPGDVVLEVGWHFIPEHWGNGYATEAARGAVEYGFREFPSQDAIYAITDLGNEASMAVCRKLGMEFLGTTDRYHNRTLNLFRLARSQA